jgi:uncharacterized membrane-anchored protein YitT (DUF2179 family)
VALTGTLIWLAVDVLGLAGIAWVIWTHPHLRIRHSLLLAAVGAPLLLALVMLLTWLSE